MAYVILIQFRYSKHRNKVFRTIAARVYWNVFNYLTHLRPIYPFLLWFSDVFRGKGKCNYLTCFICTSNRMELYYYVLQEIVQKFCPQINSRVVKIKTNTIIN